MRRFSFLLTVAAMGLTALVSCSRVSPDCAVVAMPGGSSYTGEVDSLGRPDGYGQLVAGRDTVYEGQWRHGQRYGRGTATDSAGVRIDGQWRADTLVRGTRTDSTGTYHGGLDRQMRPSGHGTMLSADGAFYGGQWRQGQRSGWGYALSPRRHLRVGEWKGDRFLGERLNYTADRIYGIDISRFQHDVGRRRYAIAWPKVRITHLGSLSRKSVSGAVDYPVSFCYIKSTEGRSLRNRYFAADYAAARRQGIRCGAYHFFSTTTPGSVQADFFLRSTRFSHGDMPPVLDVEPSARQIARMGGPGAMFRSVRAWMERVERRVGTRPVLYVSQTFVNKYLPMAPDIKQRYNIWIARYGEYKPDVHLVYWQLCPDGRVRGITPKVDINVFNGYRGEFDDFVGKNCVK